MNCRERRLNWCQLPAGHMLGQLILEPHQSVRASGDDLSNYFYLIQHLEGWQHRNCFGDRIRGKRLKCPDLSPDAFYYPAFRVVCMGDTNGVCIAQATHEALLQEAGCLRPHQSIIYGRAFPASNTLEGLYIDDHLVFQVLDKKPKRDRKTLPDEELVAASREQYQRLGLPRSSKKEFNKEYSFRAWGTDVCSRTGRVGGPVERLRQVENLTCEIVRLGRCSKKGLQKLVGLFVHPFMHRKECMAIFHHIYLFIDRIPETGEVRLPGYVQDELLSAALLLPMAAASARWPVSVQISASDASCVRGGRAATITTRAFAKTLYRFAEKKGEHTRLDWDLHALEPPSSMQGAPDAFTRTLGQHQWTATQSIKFSKPEHINLLELEMVKQELKDRVNSGRGNCRVVNLCDSRVVVGAYAKGRSSSRSMNHRLRACLAWSLAGNTQLVNLWVDTHSNPADYPSRDRQIPGPDTCAEPVLFEPDLISQVQARSTPSEQAVLEQEAQREGSDPVRQRQVAVCSGPSARRVEQGHGPCSTPRPEAIKNAVEANRTRLWGFKEVFAGRARLTQAFRQLDAFETQEPVEYKKGKMFIPQQDVLHPGTFARLLAEAANPNQLWHFGLPCSSFSILQHANHGTRRRHVPQGSGSLEREKLGNMLLHRTLRLIAYAGAGVQGGTTQRLCR